jgi:adenosylhomocysteine nucleosidase
MTTPQHNQTRIAIIAALPGELKPLVQGWKQTAEHVWTGSIGGHACMAIAGGIGAAAANRAVSLARSELDPTVLVSYGWAGALTCAVKPGMACTISEVVDTTSGKRFATCNPEGMRLITLNRVAHANEKRKLAERNQAVLVDMEAAAVARIAHQRRLRFYCFKGVSDGYTDRLPDFSRFISWEGQLRMPKFLTYVAPRPWYWASLARLGAQSRTAASALAELARASLQQSLADANRQS